MNAIPWQYFVVTLLAWNRRWNYGVGMTVKKIVSLLVFCIACTVGISTLSAHDEQIPYRGHMQILTDNFQIIFEPHDEWAAQRIAGFSDQVLAEIVQMLDHTPKRRIPVVLTSRPVVANGYYSPFPAKVFMFLTRASNRFLGSRTSDWLRSLFTHELTHHIHLTSPVGPAKFLTPIFGPEVPAMNSPLMPGWWIEGITTYMESTRAEGGRGDSPTFALTYEAPLVEQSMWSISQGAYSSNYPPRGRIYSTGYIMVDHLARTYGEEAFREINRRFSNWPFFGISPAVRKVTGRTSAELFGDALQELWDALPTVTKLPPLFSPDSVGDFHLPYPTDRGLLGFTRTLDAGGAISIHSPDGKNLSELIRIPVDAPGTVTVTRDGTSAFISYLWGDPYHKASTQLAPVSYSDLYRVDLDSHTYSRITTKARLMHPAVSPDGQRLVAIESVEDRYRLVEIDMEDGSISVLYENPDGSVYEPNFAPDGSALVFVEIVDGQSTLVVVEEQEPGRILWPHAPAELHSPRFITPGTLWVGSDFSERLSLYEVDRTSGHITLLLTDPVGITGAIPVGDSVIYSTYTSKGYALRKADSTALVAESIVKQIPQPRGTPKTVAPRLPMTPYSDALRFNLWLPFPINIPSEIVPGASVVMRSILGRHTLGASTAWSISDSLPVGVLLYRYAPGPFTFTVQANANEKYSTTDRRHSVTGSFDIPLWHESLPSGRRSLASGIAMRGTYVEDQTIGTLFGYAGYGYHDHAGPKDYYGTTRYSILGSLQYNHNFTVEDRKLVPIARVTGQVPLGRTHQILRLELDTAFVESDPNNKILTPDLLGLQTKSGEIKMLFSLRYGIPLGLFDKPVPYGGLVAAGLLLHAQTATYLTSGSPAWEEDVYIGATINADFAIGAAVTLRPYARYAISTATGQGAFTIGIDFDSFFIGSNGMVAPKLQD